MKSSIIDYLYGLRGTVDQLLSVRNSVRNWPTVIMFYLGLIHSFELRPKEGEPIRIESLPDYKRFQEEGGLKEARRRYRIGRSTIELSYRHRKVKLFFDDQEERNDLLILISEQFVAESYRELEVKGKTVIDIGANVGDTAIYFALNGARHVYSFEPYLYPYRLAVRNIRGNSLQGKVTLINAGVGGSADSSVTIDNEKSKSYTILRPSRKGVRTRMLSLNTVAERYCKGESVLKIDCEGGEYDIILNASERTLRRFKRIIIEYHDGCGGLRRKLEEAGFRIEYSRPITLSYNLKLFGMLFATRVD